LAQTALSRLFSGKERLMPARKRLPHVEAWHAIQQMCQWPEQKAYELLCPVILFGDPPGERAQETKANERTLLSLRLEVLSPLGVCYNGTILKIKVAVVIICSSTVHMVMRLRGLPRGPTSLLSAA
jgi:hypothetical protein